MSEVVMGVCTPARVVILVMWYEAAVGMDAGNSGLRNATLSPRGVVQTVWDGRFTQYTTEPVHVHWHGFISGDTTE